MTRVIHISAEELPEALQHGIDDIEARVHDIIEVTAKKAVGAIRSRVPVAFGELRESIAAVSGPEPSNIVDAPHAAAVEIGSRPHTPDIDKLIAWVKLRGLQGLASRSQIRRMAGPTTASQARLVASQLREKEVRPTRGPMFLKNGEKNPKKVGLHSPIDAAEQVARAIAATIEKVGTKPHWYVRNSLPEIEKILHAQMRSRLKQ